MNNKKNALPLLMMFLLFFVIAFATNLNGPFGKILKEQFEFSNMQSQLGTMIFFLSYLFMGIPSSWLIRAQGYKKAAIIALIIAAVATLGIYMVGIIALKDPVSNKNLAIYLYLACNFILGAAMCILNNVVNPMLTVLGSKKGANQRLNFGGALNSFGGTLAPAIAGLLIGSAASGQISISAVNPLLFLALSIFILVSIGLFFVEIPEPIIAKKIKGEKDQHSALSFRHLKFGIIAIFFYVGLEVSIPNIAFLYMTDPVSSSGLAIQNGVAGVIVGTYWLLMLIGRLIGGALGKIFSSRQMIITVSSVAIFLITVAILIPENILVKMPAINGSFGVEFYLVPFSILLLTLTGLCTSVMWPGIFNLAVDGLGKYTNQGSGLFMTMAFGGGIIPLLQGRIADIIGFQQSYIVPLAAAIIIFLFGFWGYKNINLNIPIE
ncbi:MAG: MFS transporter [Paludibacter sp.]|nr:MFS transporter [Paludibacter sp.]